jgi:hypothetical protein
MWSPQFARTYPILFIAMTLALVAPAGAVDVSLTGDDAVGETSFDTGLHWGNGQPPSGGNDYFTGDFRLRTPPDGGSYTFGGDSLTIDNTNGYSWGLLYKGSGSTGVITINDLILDGGMIAHANSAADVFQLDGSITVLSNSQIYAKQGPIEILADVSGTGSLTNPGSDGDGRVLRLLSPASTFTGDIINDGRLELVAGAQLNFVIGAPGVSNGVSGTGVANFDGVFVFDLTGASATEGDTWQIVDVAGYSFGPNFSVAGFAEEITGIWARRNYRFYESTGQLVYGPAILPLSALPVVTLTGDSAVPNGAWSWFEDERCVIDPDSPDGPRLLVSSVSSAANSDPESGDVDVTWLDLVDGDSGHFELANRLERDDHDSAALWVRPDGRYLAVYSRHTSDPLTRWRVSTNPHDPTMWNAEQTYGHSYNTTYNNLHYLPADNGGNGRLYNFSRIVNWDPTVMTSSDYGTTWSGSGKLITMGGGGDRPYVRYFSDGERIHFITTEEHPRDFDNSVYHGYVQDGVAYDSGGLVVDANILDGSGPLPTAFTPVFVTGTLFGGTPMRRAWTIDVAIDEGDPVVLFIARANGQNTDHRFFYGRHEPGVGWAVREVAAAGAYLYAAEDDYTGLAAIDPDDTSVIVLSTDVDPRDGTATPAYELYRGRTDDGGATWSWIALTANSVVDNLRPLIPSYSDGFERVLVWMRGSYLSYTNWTTEVAVMREVVPARVDWDCLAGPGVVPSLGCPAAQIASLDHDGDGDVDLRDLQAFQNDAQILAQ